MLPLFLIAGYPSNPNISEAISEDVQTSVVNLFKEHIGVLILMIIAIVFIVLLLYSAISKITDLIGCYNSFKEYSKKREY